MANATTTFHKPIREFSIVDAHNRRALALGSVRSAQLAAAADYNGHRVIVAHNEHRGYWVAEYTWGGRQVLHRGTFADCLTAALREYDRGAKGASVVVRLPDGADAEGDACRAAGFVEGDLPTNPEWLTWRHRLAASCAKDAANMSLPAPIFDIGLLEAADNEAAYMAALKSKYGRAYY